MPHPISLLFRYYYQYFQVEGGPKMQNEHFGPDIYHFRFSAKKAEPLLTLPVIRINYLKLRGNSTG
jgi:hypothetical protein